MRFRRVGGGTECVTNSILCRGELAFAQLRSYEACMCLGRTAVSKRLSLQLFRCVVVVRPPCCERLLREIGRRSLCPNEGKEAKSRERNAKSRHGERLAEFAAKEAPGRSRALSNL